MLQAKLVQQLLQPQALYSLPSFFYVVERTVHYSIMHVTPAR